jgi:hypothetical protein
MWNKRPNGSVFSRAQGLLTNQDDDHAKYHSQKARVFGVGCNTVLGGSLFPIAVYLRVHKLFDISCEVAVHIDAKVLGLLLG